MKVLIYLLFAVLFLGVTFFGLGPVLLADGTRQERMLTLTVVLLLYAILTGVFFYGEKAKK